MKQKRLFSCLRFGVSQSSTFKLISYSLKSTDELVCHLSKEKWCNLLLVSQIEPNAPNILNLFLTSNTSHDSV